MDALKAIIAKQKAQVTSLSKAGGGPGGRYFRQGDIEAQRRQQKEKEALEAAAKKRQQELQSLAELQERLSAKKFRPAPSKQEDAEQPIIPRTGEPDSRSAASAEDEQEPPIASPEIFKRLRKLKQPVTLFGETPWQRYCRLCALELQVLDDEMTEGQQNVFHAMQREGEDDEEFEEEQKLTSGGGRGGTEEAPEAPKEGQDEEDAAKSKETIIIEWTRRMLSLWEEELKQRSEEEKATADGRHQLALHRQTKKDLKPLLRKLKHKELESDICERLHEIVQLCKERRYRDAHGSAFSRVSVLPSVHTGAGLTPFSISVGAYYHAFLLFMLLAIGNAAWPMGVTMVGIHERAGRSKLNTSQVAHILNDETTRKYIQMFKRLMSFCQRKFEANPSQTILLSVHHV
ncbi:pre-mRNA splicing factor [Cyclospora cayetanensis]|uniref:Pre-mRNA-splicing factor 18 n=1 Tax=Cyclospora cayetanensis TaxID=88456 RepID=A0A1D3D590_9EIME|nr:pre-mRNA splicing factor [Cyclospora cayetanensis]